MWLFQLICSPFHFERSEGVRMARAGVAGQETLNQNAVIYSGGRT